MNISRECECGPRALEDGSRCAKCGKPLPRQRSARGIVPDFKRPPRVAVVEPSSQEVDDYERHLDAIADHPIKAPRT